VSAQKIIKVLSYLILFSNVLIVLIIIHYLFLRKKITWITSLFSDNALLLSFLISLVAVSFSLFFSEIAHFAPCKLCWLQRIFLYPLPLITGLAIWKRDYKIKSYILMLSVIGLVISTYHYAIQLFPNLISYSCGTSEVNCAEKVLFHFGYISIPFMALSAFILIIQICLYLPSDQSNISKLN